MAENEEEGGKIIWKRGRTLGKGGFAFVSLASTEPHSDADPLIPSLIAVKSSIFTEFLRMCENCPQVIPCYGVKVTQQDDILLYNLLLEYASAGSLAESLLNQEYGPKADIWALGCTLYELITGTPLWESSNSDPKFDDVLHRVKYEEPNLENDKLSTDAKDFLRNCLVKNPNTRWTAGMLLNHSFLKSADNVQLPKKRKRQRGYMSSLRRPHQKRAFRTQPHIRDLVIEHRCRV